ncbi:MAG: PadR family transcriptional regulator, regulatory protein PadR [Mycobacterium sp.]|nr:PadR family transcriptional regulator, regulatory protein PadR [Mycobacterium sp.]
MYAVDLVKRLAEIDALAATEGTIYPLLSRLRRDRAVATEWRESMSGPPRRYYSITPGGAKAINAFRGEWASFVDGVEQFLRVGGHHAG